MNKRLIAIVQNDDFSDKEIHFLKHYKIIHRAERTALIETIDSIDELSKVFNRGIVYPVEATLQN